MKSLKARVNASVCLRTGAAITLLWAAALGQATPDTQTALVPEPGILPLLGAAVVAGYLLRRRK